MRKSVNARREPPVRPLGDTMKNFVSILVAAFALCLAPAAHAQNGPANGAAQTFVREKQEAAARVLNRRVNGAAEEARRSAEVASVMNDLLDYEELAKRALSDHWATLDGAKKTEFVRLLRGLVERNYQNSLRSTLDYEVSYLGEQQAATGIVVRTTARSRRQRRAPEVSIDYTLIRIGDKFRVVDIATDGVSLVRNYRSQFNRIINRDGFDALLTRMRERLAGNGDDL